MSGAMHFKIFFFYSEVTFKLACKETNWMHYRYLVIMQYYYLVINTWYMLHYVGKILIYFSNIKRIILHYFLSFLSLVFSRQNKRKNSNKKKKKTKKKKTAI